MQLSLPAAIEATIRELRVAGHRAVVVGEDLGTVEPHVREALAGSGILGTRVFWFDQHPSAWAPLNLATVTTHDLPTVAGVWAGTDGSVEMQQALRALAGEGAEPLNMSPEQFSKHIAAEIVKWGKVTREAGIRAE